MKGQKKKMQSMKPKVDEGHNCIVPQTKQRAKLNNSAGITLVALVVSIVVMLILAGVSINAVVGDNGIITQAQSATYATSRAVLEEWINQLYVENYDDFSEYDNKMEAFLSSSYANYFYNPSSDKDTDGTTHGSVAYVVDSDGHALYLIKKSALPDDIKSQITGGDAGEGNYIDYLALTDVYGVTSDLKVYYCSAGTSTILGITVDELDNDDISRTVKISSSLASILGTDTEVTASSLRSVKTLTIDSSSGLTSLSELYNLTSLQELTLDGVTLSNLSGIQNCSQLYYVYFKSSTIGDFSAMVNLGSRLKYLYFYNIDDSELSKACTGLASAEFSNLTYLAVVGDETYICSTYVNSVSSGKSTKTIESLEPLSLLSSTTKSAVKYLSIQNNDIKGDLSYISAYTNLILLRCEYNSLTSLNGIDNASNLVYICGSYNNLGATASTDSEGTSTTVAESPSAGTAIESLADKKALQQVYLIYNTYLANVNYFENDTAIEYLYLTGCSSTMNVNNITAILDKCDPNYSIPVKYLNGSTYIVSTYYSTDSNGKSVATYNNLYSDLYGNTTILALNLTDVTITNAQLQEIVGSMTQLKAVNLSGCSNLSTIDFVKYTPNLITLMIDDTAVTDLTLLNSYASSLGTLAINNSSIDLTTIQGVISKLGTNYDRNTMRKYVLWVSD